MHTLIYLSVIVFCNIQPIALFKKSFSNWVQRGNLFLIFCLARHRNLLGMMQKFCSICSIVTNEWNNLKKCLPPSMHREKKWLNNAPPTMCVHHTIIPHQITPPYANSQHHTTSHQISYHTTPYQIITYHISTYHLDIIWHSYHAPHHTTPDSNHTPHHTTPHNHHAPHHNTSSHRTTSQHNTAPVVPPYTTSRTYSKRWKIRTILEIKFSDIFCRQLCQSIFEQKSFWHFRADDWFPFCLSF